MRHLGRGNVTPFLEVMDGWMTQAISGETSETEFVDAEEKNFV